MKKYIPGTVTYFEGSNDFEAYKKMIEIGNGITLSQICNITSLEPHMIQNWVKRGYIPHPINKKYYTKHLARILLINALRESMYIEDIGKLMVYINGDVDDESDDIISEQSLYELFSKLVYEINDYNNIEKVIDANVESTKLNKCMKAMLYGYISGLLKKKSDTFLKEIEK